MLCYAGRHRGASMHDADEGGDRITQIFFAAIPHRDKSYAPWRSTRQPNARCKVRTTCTSLQLQGRTKPADTSSFCASIADRTVLAENQPPHSPTLTYPEINYSSTASTPAVDTGRTLVVSGAAGVQVILYTRNPVFVFYTSRASRLSSTQSVRPVAPS